MQFTRHGARSLLILALLSPGCINAAGQPGLVPQGKHTPPPIPGYGSVVIARTPEVHTKAHNTSQGIRSHTPSHLYLLPAVGTHTHRCPALHRAGNSIPGLHLDKEPPASTDEQVPRKRGMHRTYRCAGSRTLRPVVHLTPSRPFHSRTSLA